MGQQAPRRRYLCTSASGNTPWRDKRLKSVWRWTAWIQPTRPYKGLSFFQAPTGVWVGWMGSLSHLGYTPSLHPATLCHTPPRQLQGLGSPGRTLVSSSGKYPTLGVSPSRAPGTPERFVCARPRKPLPGRTLRGLLADPWALALSVCRALACAPEPAGSNHLPACSLAPPLHPGGNGALGQEAASTLGASSLRRGPGVPMGTGRRCHVMRADSVCPPNTTKKKVHLRPWLPLLA